MILVLTEELVRWVSLLSQNVRDTAQFFTLSSPDCRSVWKREVAKGQAVWISAPLIADSRPGDPLHVLQRTLHDREIHCCMLSHQDLVLLVLQCSLSCPARYNVPHKICKQYRKLLIRNLNTYLISFPHLIFIPYKNTYILIYVYSLYVYILYVYIYMLILHSLSYF